MDIKKEESSGKDNVELSPLTSYVEVEVGEERQQGNACLQFCKTCVKILFMMPFFLFVLFFLLGPMLLVYGLYFSFRDAKFYKKYADDGISIQGTVVERSTSVFVDGVHVGFMGQSDNGIDIHYTSPEDQQMYKLMTTKKYFSPGQQVELTVMAGYPKSAISNGAKAFQDGISTVRLYALVLGLIVPIGSGAGLFILINSYSYSIPDLVYRSGILNVRLSILVTILACQFIVAFVIDYLWWKAATTKVLTSNASEMDATYDESEEAKQFAKLIPFSNLIFGVIPNPLLAEIMAHAVSLAIVLLCIVLIVFLVPPLCIWYVLLLSCRFRALYKHYLTEGVPTLGVVTSFGDEHSMTAQYKCAEDGRNYKIQRATKPSQDYCLGQELPIMVLPDHPKSGQEVRYLEDLLNGLFCTYLVFFVAGCLGALLSTFMCLPLLFGTAIDGLSMDRNLRIVLVATEFVIGLVLTPFIWTGHKESMLNSAEEVLEEHVVGPSSFANTEDRTEGSLV
eukprot:scaffold226669_cov57-Attheya_sp.AAC.2